MIERWIDERFEDLALALTFYPTKFLPIPKLCADPQVLVRDFYRNLFGESRD
jgi:hypothetical protein